MSAERLLADLRRRGIELRVFGGRLQYRPLGTLTSEDAKTLRAHRAELLRRLQTDATTGLVANACEVFGVAPAEVVVRPRGSAGPPPLVCYFCRGRRFWRSVYGVTVCARCYPPAAERLVAAWLTSGEATSPR